MSTIIQNSTDEVALIDYIKIKLYPICPSKTASQSHPLSRPHHWTL